MKVRNSFQERKKNTFEKTIELNKKRKMASKLFEIQEQFKIDTYLIKLTLFEKTGSKVFFLFRLKI